MKNEVKKYQSDCTLCWCDTCSDIGLCTQQRENMKEIRENVSEDTIELIFRPPQSS